MTYWLISIGKVYDHFTKHDLIEHDPDSQHILTSRGFTNIADNDTTATITTTTTVYQL